MLDMVPKPTFSGQPRDFANFKAEWDEYERAIAETCGPVSQFAMLTLYKECLDEASQVKLGDRMQRDPNLTLRAFKRELQNERGADSQKQHRAEWEAVVLRLTGPPGRELTLQDWRLYEAVFKLHRNRVLERTAAEERKMVFSKLPLAFQRQLVEENVERRETRPWVRVRYPPSLNADEVRAAIGLHLPEPLPVVQESNSSLVIKAKNANQQNKLLDLEDARVNGKTLKACRFDYEMSGDEMFVFITKRLSAEEELQAMLEAYGCAQPTKPTHGQVECSEAEGAAREPSPRRGTSKGVHFSQSGVKRYPQVCYRCKRAGRLFVHNHKACKFAAEEDKGKGEQKKAQSLTSAVHSPDESPDGSSPCMEEGGPQVRAE